MIIASATAAALVAGQIGAKASRDTLFLSNYPAADLPRVMLVAALFSLIASVLFAGLLRRQGPRVVIPALLILSALLWAGEWSLYASQPRLVAELIFLHLATFGATVISGFWSVVNERFNPHEAKRAVARIVAGSTLGGAVGGVLTERTASLFGAPATLLLLALFSLGAAAGVRWLGGGEAPVARVGAPVAPPVPLGETQSQRRYFTSLAILSLLVATLSALVEYGMKARAAEASATSAELMQLFSYLYTGAALASFFTQLMAGRQTLERLGLGGALGLLPLLVALLSFGAATAGGLGLAAATSVVFSVISNSVYRAGYEILYTPVAPDQKRSLKMLIDVGATRAGDALGSGLILGVVALSGALAAAVSSAIAGFVALGALAATYAVQRGYVRALAESLRRGVLAIDDSQIIDRTTRQTVTTHLDLDRARLLEDIRAHRAQELSPENITDPEHIDGRSDLYSLGAVGYYLLTAQHVFGGRTPVEVCSHHLHTPPEPPSQRLGRPLPARLEALILACLAKDPRERPAGAAELSEALAHALEQGSWSQQDARQWWAAHGAEARAKRASAPLSEGHQTIAVGPRA